MPIRDFKCRNCGEVFERICRTETHTIKCRKCGGDARSLLSAPKTIHFLGSGFYQTDYKGA